MYAEFKFLHGYKFPKFVDYILEKQAKSGCNRWQYHKCGQINKHWRPMYAICFYCDFLYNVIGRIETFEEDVKYIALKNNLHCLMDKISLRKNKSGGYVLFIGTGVIHYQLY